MGTAVIERGGGYVTIINDNYQILDCNRKIIEVNAATKNITITLPRFATLEILASGFIFIKKTDTTANTVTIKSHVDDINTTINGINTSIILSNQNEFVNMVFDDTNATTGKYNLTIISQYIKSTNTTFGVSKGDGTTISSENGILSVIGGSGGSKYPTYLDYNLLPTDLEDKTIAVVLTTTTVSNNIYSAGLWQYVTNTWQYLGMNIDNITLKYENNILKVNVGTNSGQIIKLDDNGLPQVSSENTKIGAIVEQNFTIADNDIIKTAFGKTQGQLNNKNNLVKNAIENNLASFDATGQIKDSGFSVNGNLTTKNNNSPTTQIPTVGAVNAGLATKANKIASPVADDVLLTDANGQPIDSGKKIVTIISNTPTDTEIPTAKAINDVTKNKANLITNSVNGNIVTTDANGQPIDSGKTWGNDGTNNNVTTSAEMQVYVTQQLLNTPSLPPVMFATTTNDSLSGLTARDGYTPIAGMPAEVKNQTNTSNNGIWITSAGAWSRAFYNKTTNNYEVVTTQTKYSELNIANGVVNVLNGTVNKNLQFQIFITNPDAAFGSSAVTITATTKIPLASPFARYVDNSLGNDTNNNGSQSFPFLTIAKCFTGASYPLIININCSGSAYVMPTTLTNNNVRFLGSGSVTSSQTAITGTSITVSANFQSFENLNFQIPIILGGGFGHNFENCQSGPITNPVITTSTSFVNSYFKILDSDFSGNQSIYTLDLSLGSGAVYITNVNGLRIKFGTNANIRIFLTNCPTAVFDNTTLGNIFFTDTDNIIVNAILTTQTQLTTLLADTNVATDGYYTTQGFTPNVGSVGDILYKQSVQGVITFVLVHRIYAQTLNLTFNSITYIKNGNGLWVKTSNIPLENCLVLYDVNKNINANNFNKSINKTVASTNVLLLTVKSSAIQHISGTISQPIKLDDATTFPIGFQFLIQNNTDKIITITSFTNPIVGNVIAQTDQLLTLLDNTTQSGTWRLEPKSSGSSGVTEFKFTNKNGISGEVATPTTIPNLSLSIDDNSISNAKLTQMSAIALKGSTLATTNTPQNVEDILANDIKKYFVANNTIYKNFDTANNTYKLKTYEQFIVVRNNIAGTNIIVVPDGSSGYEIVKGLIYTIVNSNQSAIESIINVIGTIATIQLNKNESCQVQVDENNEFQLIGNTTTGSNYIANSLTTGKVFMGNNVNKPAEVTLQGAIRVKDAATGEVEINDNQVTTAKIVNNTVTLAKIETIPAKTILTNNSLNPAIPKATTVDETLALLNINQITQTKTINNPTTGTILTKNEQLVIITNAQTIQSIQMPDPSTTLGILYFFYNDVNSAKLIQINNNIEIPTIVYANVNPGQNCVLQSDGTKYRVVVQPLSVGGWQTYTPAITGTIQSPIFSGAYLLGKYYVINNIMTLLFTFTIPMSGEITQPGNTAYYLISIPSEYLIDTSVVASPSSAFSFYDGTILGNGFITYGTSPTFYQSSLIVQKSPTTNPLFSNNLSVQTSISSLQNTQLQYWRNPGLYVINKSMALYFTAQIPVVLA